MQIKAVLVGAACLLGTATAQKMKIMPLGDSITEITCWRSKLWDLLASEGVTDSIEFVGSMTNNPQNCQAAAATWDKHHEGHSGYLAINIANQNLQGWLTRANPDLVMFMLGTNDVFQGRTTDAIMAAYTKMVDLMRANNPNMKIIVDTVIPLGFGGNGVNQINAAIPGWAAEHNSTESPIWVADVSATYPQGNAGLRDGVHPNDAGDVVIADTLAPLLSGIIKASTAAGSGKTSARRWKA